MKRILSFLLVITALGGCHDFPEQEIETANKEDAIITRSFESNDYYYGSTGRIPIAKSLDKSYVLIKADAANLQESLLNANIADIHDIQDYNIIMPNVEKLPNLFANLRSGIGKIEDISSLIKLDDVVYAAPYYIFSNGGKEYPLTNVFYVELLSPKDIVKLEKIAAENNVTIVHKIPLTENAYTLSCTKESKGNALEMANLFYETGLFLSSAPEFLSVEFESPNDSYFSGQWGLKNTGQYGGTTGIDINLDDARSLTTGSSNVTIAVIDEGMVNHPDLTVTYAHDAITQVNTMAVYGNHGTAVAGIIGAKANNGIGVAGIAPGCKLMSISTYFTIASLAYALRYAANNGADVINNSWIADADMPVVNSAIKYALQSGRGGKGCVVVFCAGNDNNSGVAYPCASDPDIMVVGAISFNGKRKSPSTPDGEWRWGSNYGAALDVVAPGVLVPTIDIQAGIGYNPNIPIHIQLGGNKRSSDYVDQDYTAWFCGTSAAAPHVSGIAALILSKYPTLTQRQVADRIESTAQKVGGYIYHATLPNGTWHQEMGYGLVDAYAALTGTSTPPNTPTPVISKELPYSSSTIIFSVNNPQSGTTYQWEINGTIMSTGSYPYISFLSSNPQTASINVTVRCRAVRNGNTSAWSNSISHTVQSLTPVSPHGI